MPSATGGITAEVLNYNRGLQPVIAVGGGTAQGMLDGLITKQISSAGISPGATGADNVLAIFSLPAGTFDGVGNRGLRFFISGTIASSANTKLIKIFFNATTAVVGATISGGTAIATTGSQTTITAFTLEALVYKYGVLGSNTQITQQLGGGTSGAALFAVAPVLTTAVESGAILCAVTGNAGTTASDILLNIFEIRGIS